jgi:glucose-1-phosphate adenylyltransferase
VRQHLRYCTQPGIDYVLILSGDQLYHMNYNAMLETHKKSKADVTIAALPVDAKQAAGFGIMRLDDDGSGRKDFSKSRRPKKNSRSSVPIRGGSTRAASRAAAATCLASMGIYIFNREVLVDDA